MPKTPPPLGNVNACVSSSAWIESTGERIHFDGTTLGLTLAAVNAGAAPGTRLRVCFGGHLRHDARTMVITPDGGGDRTPGGVWADRIRDERGRVIE